jgi:hypothetical protein
MMWWPAGKNQAAGCLFRRFFLFLQYVLARRDGLEARSVSMVSSSSTWLRRSLSMLAWCGVGDGGRGLLAGVWSAAW